VDGLAVASDLGIAMHTVALAVLLHRFRLVSLATLEYGELARAALAAGLAFVGTMGMVRVLPLHAGKMADVLTIVAGSAVWAGICFVVLRMTGSGLIAGVPRRKPA
jgi:putative peptidoglycan lipid II flippase